MTVYVVTSNDGVFRAAFGTFLAALKYLTNTGTPDNFKIVTVGVTR